MDFIDLKTQYRLTRVNINARIQQVLDRGDYIMGTEVLELETRLAAFCGAKHTVAVASGTDALLISMMALGISRGDEVITTPFTFIATAEMIALLGATPVFVDIDPDTCNIDVSRIAAAITPRTRLILPVSLYGQCPDMDGINELARTHGLPVLEDAAQSFGATYHGRHSGALSTIGCTSFYPSKPLGCYGDGGACFTDDDQLATRMRQIRDHGQSARYRHTCLGINGRLDTLQAAILLVKLELFPGEVAARQRLGTRYNELIAAKQIPVECLRIATEGTSVYAQYTVRVAARDQVAAALRADSIPTAIHYPLPLHLQPVFAGLGHGHGAFPHAETAAVQVLSLPMHPYLSETDQQRVVAALAAACEKSAR